MKRYRYRKVTPEMVKRMKMLRNEGMFYKDIARKFEVCYETIAYHLSEKAKKRKIKQVIEYNNRLTKKQRKEKTKRYQPYTSQYIKERYNNDEEFRLRFLDHVKRSAKKMLKERREKGLCTRCGRVKENKRWTTCEKCREKKRDIYRRRNERKNKDNL